MYEEQNESNYADVKQLRLFFASRGCVSRCSAFRSAFSERVALENPSHLNGLDFELLWFGTRRSVVQIHSPRPL
jgi:hypothetical protein